ncbi:hypothetical protein KUCAC02_003122 [Chaenocephalus aceratus]|uniref:Uncharacterized protein n=1 Tax=Chaenocephalus aceratus TaxID=36190 RepID=A0ACB9WKH8_CHAAC|nr:hypothetical protein KUCAC02_003122 [Chaenocephalus aceratus]
MQSRVRQKTGLLSLVGVDGLYHTIPKKCVPMTIKALSARLVALRTWIGLRQSPSYEHLRAEWKQEEEEVRWKKEDRGERNGPDKVARSAREE